MDDVLYITVCHFREKRYAHDAFVDFLCVRAEATLVAHMLVVREEVRRDVVYLAADALCFHRVEEFAARAAECAWV